ncbi:hypothetical protein OOT00_14710 [Desulfobotulus sp. H1]|uniref:Uncharacterized protein n=1 Tax=Desulfobotulus pelophilus TaxID=2823377 RepID=A0ABT3NEA8_9BACT|nr:hypothetical protein [Desulfobotulus pelophilus]MCW7755237.1 hypothetical protein [Desulfobotulus pelophilus]
MSDDVEQCLDWFLERSDKALDSELATTDRIRDRIAFISGVLLTPAAVIVVSLLSTYGAGYFAGLGFWLFSVPASLSILLLLVSLAFVFFVLFRGFEYKAGIKPPALFEYYQGGSSIKESICDTKHILLMSLNESISHNAGVNRRRMTGILRAQVAATLAIPFVLASMPYYFYVQTVSNEKEAVVVEILQTRQPLEVVMTEDTNKIPASSQQSPAAPSQPLIPEPTRPAPPTEKFFDSVIPPKGEGNKTLNE